MKFQLLLPILTLSLMACGQFAPSAKNEGTKTASVSAGVAGCPALQLHNADSGVEANLLTTYYACPGANANSVIIKYNLMNAGYTMCVYPGNGASFGSQSQCFTPSSYTGQVSLQFNSSLNSVAIVEQQNRSSFEGGMTMGFGGSSAPYASVQFR